MKYVITSTPTNFTDSRIALGEQFNDAYELHMFATVYGVPIELVRYLRSANLHLSILYTATADDLKSLYPEYFI